MTKARMTSVLWIVAILLAVAAAILNTINNGRVTWRAVAGVLIITTLALVNRAVMPGSKADKDKGPARPT